MSENLKFKPVATKVSMPAYARLKKLCVAKGLSIYDLLQMVCDTLIRYMDDRHNLTPEMEKAMGIFEHMEGWKSAFNLTDPSVDRTILEAIYFLYDKSGEKHGTRAVHVSQPFFGEWKQDMNVQNIFETVVKRLFPQKYSRLQKLAEDYKCVSILELVDLLLDLHADEADMAELRKTFEDADRSDYGVKPDDVHYKRKMHQDIDMFRETEQRRAEREKESEESRQWLDENMDYKPCGYEW